MAFDPNKPANDGFLADAPQELRTNFAGLKDDQIVNAGSLRGLVPGNASGNIPISNGTLNINLVADKVDGLDASDFASASHVHSVATGSSNGFMSNTDKQKLDGIQAGAEVNQNAFSNILVNGTTIQADSKTDTLELVAGTNISLSPNATNDRVTINCTYTHPTGDGNLHVPATGTSNNGKVLKAGASAGSIAWGTLSASDITNTPAGNISATTVQAAINELDSEKVSVSEVVTTATANKILKLDSNGKLPASITGDAATVGGKTPGTGANNVLVLDASGRVPSANGGVPSGIICMWSGSASNIPSGWALCDGTNGTPDLRDRFIVGAGNSYAVGATGGEAFHTLTINEMPGHSHSLMTPTGKTSEAWGLASNHHGLVGIASSEGGYLSTNAAGHTFVSTTGGGQPHENRPPYYALCFIMKL